MKKQVKKLLGAAGVSLAALSIGTPTYAAGVSCDAGTAFEIFTNCYIGAVTSPTSSFTDVSIGDLTLSLVSDILGAFPSLTNPPGNLTVTSATLTSGGTTITSDLSPTGFSFDNVASGTYTVSLSGMLSGPPVNGSLLGAFAGGFRVIPQIPEPETYALLLAGLLTIGFVARRRSQG